MNRRLRRDRKHAIIVGSSMAGLLAFHIFRSMQRRQPDQGTDLAGSCDDLINFLETL
jgi:surfactin synthase thioesterase subunit